MFQASNSNNKQSNINIINMQKLLFTLISSFIVFSINAQTLLDTAINFTVKDTYGNTLQLYDILDEGKIVVIDFFSTT